jgi:hypothetical protein
MSSRRVSKAKRTPAANAEFSVSFEKTVSMTYYTEVYARDEADAIAQAEADNHAWNEGRLVNTSKPKARRVP